MSEMAVLPMGQKRGGRALFRLIACALFNFPLCGFSLSGQPAGFAGVSQLDFANLARPNFAPGSFPEDLMSRKAQKSVWKIRDSRGSGTAFAIGPRLFVTNFHIMRPLLKGSSINNILLQQEGNPSRLKIHRILQVSALHDLALFETEESMGDHLSLAEGALDPDEELFVLGYPKGKFKKMRQTEKAEDRGYFYIVPVNHFYLSGASGSPLLNREGQAVGILSLAYGNISIVTPAKRLTGLLAGNKNLNCSDFIDPLACMNEAIENLKRMAEQGNAYAQYRLALRYESRGGEQNLDKAFYWIKKSSEQGFKLAQNYLGGMYYTGRGTAKDLRKAFIWHEKSAKQGYAPAQSRLARMYFYGEGKKPADQQLAFKWMRKSAKKGYAVAQLALADMYYFGAGIEKNMERVFYWMEKFSRSAHSKTQNPSIRSGSIDPLYRAPLQGPLF